MDAMTKRSTSNNWFNINVDSPTHAKRVDQNFFSVQSLSLSSSTFQRDIPTFLQDGYYMTNELQLLNIYSLGSKMTKQ